MNFTLTTGITSVAEKSNEDVSVHAGFVSLDGRGTTCADHELGEAILKQPGCTGGGGTDSGGRTGQKIRPYLPWPGIYTAHKQLRTGVGVCLVHSPTNPSI